MPDEVQSLTLKLTEEDIRVACNQCSVPFAGLVAIWRRFRSQDDSIQMADVLYVMALAKSKNLNPIDNNYALIPRGGNKGFSLTFTKDAALQVILNHPRAKPGTFKRWFVNGKGERVEWSKSPSWKLAKESEGGIDWNLEAHCSVEDIDGTVLEGVAKYRNVFAAGQDGNPKPLWMKDAGGMTMKQAYKDLANTQFSGSLPDDEDPNGAPELPATQAPARGLPPPSIDIQPSIPQDVRERIAQKGILTGRTAEVILGGLEGFIASGGDAEGFERGLDAEIKKIEAKAEKVKFAKAPPAEKPAAEKPKATPKPVITIQGTIDDLTMKYKSFPKKEGRAEPGRQQFLILEVQGVDHYLWDTKLHDEARAAYLARSVVQIGYLVSLSKEDPPNEFREVKEFQVLEAVPEAPVEEPHPDEPQPAPEPQAAPEPEAPQEAGTSPEFPLLF